ncbi:hypothetical protein [Membranihabitans maritimus]|uniref:hypothetical protein n=1 Tax=Membranihabitans maritimus TaxID=2904244 RepID=UPI001F414EDC|nr:hypothetical protein [Membranihabitans maritimus]
MDTNLKRYLYVKNVMDGLLSRKPGVGSPKLATYDVEGSLKKPFQGSPLDKPQTVRFKSEGRKE